MFVENKKGCLTEIFKQTFLIKENKITDFFGFFSSFKMFMTVIKYRTSGENQRVPPALSRASHVLKEYLAFRLCCAGMGEELLLYLIFRSL